MINKKYLLSILHLFLFILLFLLAYRGILFKGGVLGHNWDWSVPVLPSELKELGSLFLGTWNENFLGQPTSFGLSSIPYYLGVYVLGSLGVTGEAFSRILLTFVSFMSYASFYILFSYILIVDQSVKYRGLALNCAFLGSVFYSFSPFVFNEFNGGALTHLISYSFLPLFVFLYVKYLNTPRVLSVNLIAPLLVFFLISISIQNMLFTLGLVLATTLYKYLIFRRKGPLTHLLVFGVFILLLNLFWIFPTLSSFSFFKSSFLDKKLFTIGTLTSGTPSWYEILVGVGYFRDFYTASLSKVSFHFAFLSGYVLVGLSLIGFAISNTVSKKFKYFFSLVLITYIISLVFSVGVTPPFGDFIFFLYQHVPLFNLFRSPQHFITMTTFSLASFLTLGFYSWFNFALVNKIKRKFLYGAGTIIMSLLILFLNGFFYRGDLGVSYFKSFRPVGNYIDLFSYPPDYSRLKETLYQDQSSTYVLPVPPEFSPLFLRNEFQNYGQGGDPFLLSLGHPIVARGASWGRRSKEIFENLEEHLYTYGFSSGLEKYLKILGIKFILVRDDVIANFGPYGGIDLRDYFEESLVNYSKDKGEIEEFSKAKIASIETLPRIFATQRLKGVYYDDLTDIDWSSLLESYENGTVFLKMTGGSNKTFQEVVLQDIRKTSQRPVIKVYRDGDYKITMKSTAEIADKENLKFNISEVPCAEGPAFPGREGAVEITQSDSIYLKSGCYDINPVGLNSYEVYKDDLMLVSSSSIFSPYVSIEYIELNDVKDFEDYYVSLSYLVPSNLSGELVVWTSNCQDLKQKVAGISKEKCSFIVHKRLPMVFSQGKQELNFGFHKKRWFQNYKTGLAVIVSKTDSEVFGTIRIENLNVLALFNPVASLNTIVKKEAVAADSIPVEFSKIDKTKYLVKILEKPQKPFLLYFGQAFDTGWRLRRITDNTSLGSKIQTYGSFNSTEYKYLGKEKPSFPPLISKGLGEHLEANAFANGWYIDPFSPDYSNLYVIEYVPQHFYFYGLLISILTFISLFILVVALKRRST
ncbi:hypothetical protein A2716_03625 [candidate division WWE3 bacterium RIFCSPHIGHO2_01_FULL_40_23]|uniref:Membrane protein 6-pyruvoyl-tetrahydropterin synthase-related domain-containing protein n=1 Tax=candidate division WWE3 bacterium RIFCSPLOWO2_01_FULL_41_18 TaxID=1802625 RepID=A0A1F4VCW3_UNCKA|nr:MAG: hypothetical protein A2716_03625 [candidate division WWE3 bacterium RIFCSPHIGHO2_01_FULL_40_23]OGC54969.1 MAG: hypothetical protein A3A78_03235 [candidate division WWE3 bacterium RIFCSPLOWO2_01_FULL_41_18]